MMHTERKPKPVDLVIRFRINEIDPQKRFARVLMLARIASGFSRAELARALNVTPQVVGHWESGRRGKRSLCPDGAMFGEIIKVLGQNPDIFWN